MPAPELRIVSEDLWTRGARAAGELAPTVPARHQWPALGTPASGIESKYLLPGSRAAGPAAAACTSRAAATGRRAYFYACTSFHLRGSSVCANSLEVPMERSDLAVLASIERDVLQPDVIAATLRKALERLKPQAAAAQEARQEVEKRLQTVERDLERLTAAVTAGGELSTLVPAIKEREAARGSSDWNCGQSTEPERLRPSTCQGRARPAHEVGRVEGLAPEARSAGPPGTQEAAGGPARVHSNRGRGPVLRVSAPIAIGRIISGLAGANMVASPGELTARGHVLCPAWLA